MTNTECLKECKKILSEEIIKGDAEQIKFAKFCVWLMEEAVYGPWYMRKAIRALNKKAK